MGSGESLLRYIQIMGDASAIPDAISAKKFGKFPNRNFAEELANITGVGVTVAAMAAASPYEL